MSEHNDKVGTYVHGSMDTRAQEKVFAGFLRMVTWGIGIAVLVLIVMALANS